jgi:hypothetical protein
MTKEGSYQDQLIKAGKLDKKNFPNGESPVDKAKRKIAEIWKNLSPAGRKQAKEALQAASSPSSIQSDDESSWTFTDQSRGTFYFGDEEPTIQDTLASEPLPTPNANPKTDATRQQPAAPMPEPLTVQADTPKTLETPSRDDEKKVTETQGQRERIATTTTIEYAQFGQRVASRAFPHLKDPSRREPIPAATNGTTDSEYVKSSDKLPLMLKQKGLELKNGQLHDSQGPIMLAENEAMAYIKIDANWTHELTMPEGLDQSQVIGLYNEEGSAMAGSKGSVRNIELLLKIKKGEQLSFVVDCKRNSDWSQQATDDRSLLEEQYGKAKLIVDYTQDKVRYALVPLTTST